MEEEKEKSNKDAASLLHKDTPLQSLRSYQGDVAEIIKKQNESVATIATKEKVRQEEQKETVPRKALSRNLPVSIFTLLLSLLLIGGSYLAIFFVFKFIQNQPESQILSETALIPFSSRATISGATRENLGSELSELLDTGVVLVQLEKLDGKQISTSKELLNLLGARAPSTLERNLTKEFALGTHTSVTDKTFFLILRTQEFGAAFSGLLDWESAMREGLTFLDTKIESTSTPYAWKDLIIKNKDVRALVNQEGDDDIVLAYTFLDKNTILIANNLSGLSELTNIYASRTIAR